MQHEVCTIKFLISATSFKIEDQSAPLLIINKERITRLLESLKKSFTVEKNVTTIPKLKDVKLKMAFERPTLLDVRIIL